MYWSGCEKHVISMACAAELLKVCCQQAFLHVLLVLTPPLPVQRSIIEGQICQGWCGVGAGENKDGEGHVTQMLTSPLMPSHSSCFPLHELQHFMLELVLSEFQLFTVPSNVCVCTGRHGRHSSTRPNLAKSYPEVLSREGYRGYNLRVRLGIHPHTSRMPRVEGLLCGDSHNPQNHPRTHPTVCNLLCFHNLSLMFIGMFQMAPFIQELAIRMPMTP